MKKTVYIFSDGEFQRKDNTLFFQGTDFRKFIPVEDVGELQLFGEVDFNKRALEFLSQKEIIVHLYNHYGYYIGSFYPREHLNAGLVIVKQAEHYLVDEKRITLARKFVSGAVRNIEQVLRYYANRGKELTAFLQQIQGLAGGLDRANEVAELMALEGNIREVYYHAFDIILNDPLFKFEKRTRRPPQNYLNTLISFGNSLMYTTVLSEIYKTHLDPRIGFLHATNFRRFSLNLDAAEIFKPIIVDRLIFTLVNKGMIGKNDYEPQMEGLSLTEKGRRTFVQGLDERMQTTIQHRGLGRNVSYRTLIRLEIHKLEKHILGENTYEPFLARW